MDKNYDFENAVEVTSVTTEHPKSKNRIKKRHESKLRKTLRIIKNIICWGVLAILVLTVVVFMSSKVNGKAPSFFGYSVLRVSTGSMQPELMIGDVILGKCVDNPTKLKVGDVITYQGSGKTEGLLVTHKIIIAPHKTDDGTYKLQTKGVANEIADPEISTDDVRYIMVCKLGFIDTLYNLFLSPWGLLIFIAVLLLIFIDEIVVIIRILSGHDKSAKDGDINEIIERLQQEKLQERSDKSDKTKE
nr:signal peptidase I [uncultured Ruminococcus sp.]